MTRMEVHDLNVALYPRTCTCRPRLWIADWTIASVLSATAGDRPRTGDKERICAARDGEGLLRAIVVGISSNSSAASAVKDSSRLSPMYKCWSEQKSTTTKKHLQWVMSIISWYAKGKGSLTTWNDKGKTTTNSRRRVFAQNVDFSFIVSGSENLYLSRIIEYTTYNGNVSSIIS